MDDVAATNWDKFNSPEWLWSGGPEGLYYKSGGSQDPTFQFLDHVDVQLVPEPFTAVLAGLLVLRRRREPRRRFISRRFPRISPALQFGILLLAADDLVVVVLLAQ